MRKLWDFRGKEGWCIGVALDHYRYQRVIPKNTKDEKISNTVEFRHKTITNPVVTPEYSIIHGLTTLTDALIDAPTDQSDANTKPLHP